VSLKLSGDGTRLVTGSPVIYNEVLDLEGAGIVSVFEYDGASWNQLGSQIIGDQEDAFFGDYVSCNNDGTRIVVGQTEYSANGLVSNGRTSVYDRDTAASADWTLFGEAFGTLDDAWFGFAVDMSQDGNYIAATAPNQGGIYAYNIGSGAGTGLVAIGSELTDNYAWTLSMSPTGARIAGGTSDDGKCRLITSLFSLLTLFSLQESSQCMI
jgi:WD40 repeat protein